jgi:hypothetical protein
MLPRLLIKRFSHIHTPSYTLTHKSNCYENIHKLNNLREDVNEIKNILQSYHEPFKILYITNIMTFIGATLVYWTK